MTRVKNSTKQHDREVTDCPVYWFVVLEAARSRGDFDTAANAKRELDRLGVRVSYRTARQKDNRQDEP